MHYKTNDDMLICELSFEGLTIEVIAEKMEASIAEVLTTLHEYAVEFTQDMHKNELIKLLLKSGMTNNQVVRLTGFNASSVSSIKCQLGLAKKTPRSDKSFAERYKMVVSLVSDGMTVTEACLLMKEAATSAATVKSSIIFSSD